MRKRGNFLLFSLLIVLSVLLCRVDIFLRKGQNRGPGRIINKSGKTIEEEWDRELLAGIRRFFLPQWKKEIFDQRRNIEKAGGIPEREIGAYLALARAYKKKGRYKEAKNACLQVLSCYPNHPLRKKVYLELTSIYDKEGNFTGARGVDKLLIYEFPDDSEVVKAKLRIIATYEREKKYREAAEQYEKFLLEYPKVKDADYLFFKMGLLYKKLGNLSKAKEIFTSVSEGGNKLWSNNARGELWLEERKGPPPKNIYYAGRVTSAPVIDGKLDEDCWVRADKAAGYLLAPDGGKPTEKTKSFLLYDENYLYIASICYESRIGMLKTRVTKRDGKVWEDDSVEYFIDINRDYFTYYQLIANSIGAKYDKECGTMRDAGWDCQWKAGSLVGRGFWSCETAIPFAGLEVSPPEKGEVWGVNLARNIRTIPKSEYAAWSGHDGHNPESFGYLIFL